MIYLIKKKETTNPTGIISLPPRAFSTGQRTGIDTRCDSSHRRMAQPCLLLLLSFGLFTLLFFSEINVRSLVCFFMFTVALPLNHQSKKEEIKAAQSDERLWGISITWGYYGCDGVCVSRTDGWNLGRRIQKKSEEEDEMNEAEGDPYRSFTSKASGWEPPTVYVFPPYLPCVYVRFLLKQHP